MTSASKNRMLSRLIREAVHGIPDRQTEPGVARPIMSTEALGPLFERDLAVDGSGIEDACVNTFLQGIRARRSAAEEQVSKLKKAAEAATREYRFWTRMDEYISKGWPLHALRELNESAGLLPAIQGSPGPTVDLETVGERMRTEADIQAKRFPALLDEECSKLALPLNREASRHPKYYFKDNFLQLEVLEKHERARLRDPEGRLAELPADVMAVALAVDAEISRLFGRTFDAPRFLRRLLREYKAHIKKGKLAMGESIPVRKIASGSSKGKRNARVDEFIVDLSRLLETGPTSVGGFVLDLQQTKDTSEGLLLLGAAGRGYVGFLSFREEER